MKKSSFIATVATAYIVVFGLMLALVWMGKGHYHNVSNDMEREMDNAGR